MDRSEQVDIDEVVRHSWSESDRFVPRLFIHPTLRFLHWEAASGVVMMLAAIIAITWANSPWHAAYETLWTTPLHVSLGDFHFTHFDHLDLRLWLNDGLMAVFFFVVGMEIKREIVHGALRDPRAAALPVVAALGGMLVPAGIYTLFNLGEPSADGWGIPMATDIAFAVGVVSLLGRRVPSGAKLFLLTLAVADDLGAIAVIAIFYTDKLSVPYLVGAIATLVVASALNRGEVRSLVPYVVLATICWFCLLESGVHATIAGVTFGFLTPAWSFYDPKRFGRDARRLIAGIERSFTDQKLTYEEADHNEATLANLVRLSHETRSPLDRTVEKLHPWVAFGIIPLFAFANAGVRISTDGLGSLVTEPVVLGVGLGLVMGKTIGVFLAAFVAVQLGVGKLPANTTWRHIFGLSICAGIGFTVALFVASLSFEGAESATLLANAKIGILAGSLLAGILGYLFLRRCPVVTDTDTESEAEEDPLLVSA